MHAIWVVLILLSAFLALPACAAVNCLDADGEAVIINNDLPSAKAEAIARAKWTAVEQTVGVEVKSQSIVQNMALVDEAISKQVSGVVSSFKVLKVNNSPEVLSVRINACVEPTKARSALGGMALNNAIAVFLPAGKPGQAAGGAYEEANILSETLIDKLTAQGYRVVDVAPTRAVDAADMEKALKSGNFLTLRSLMYKFLTNVLLIGKVDYTLSSRKGEDAGYGLAMPFNNVTSRLTYRLITRDASGQMIVLSAGAEQAKGLASNAEDAAAEGLKKLAEKMTPVILDKVGKHIQGVAKRIEVKVEGIHEVSDNFAVKEVLQNAVWVTGVEEKGLGKFIVAYPENPVYLANSIAQKAGFRVVNFTPQSIQVRYMK